MQWPFKDWGADAVLTGHDHIYERLLVNGIPYFVNGIGGARSASADPPAIPAATVVLLRDVGAPVVMGVDDRGAILDAIESIQP